MKTRMLTEPISYADGAKYLEDIPTSLRSLFNFHLGGTLPAKTLRDWANETFFSGFMAWFCYNDSVPLTPRIHLAFECKRDGFEYPKQDPHGASLLAPAPGNLLIPSHHFAFDLDTIERGEFEPFLLNHTITTPNVEREKHSSDVKKYVQNYLRLPLISPVQKYGHGYFENSPDGKDEKYVTKFMNQAGVEFVRYYFGFNPTTDPNFIRIILVPVNKDGKNMDPSKDILSDPPLLQKSVPPPPL